MSLPASFTLRPMSDGDVADAVSVIAQLDGDDAAEAQELYADDLLGFFVLTDADRVVGTTGATPIEGTSGSYVLSSTHILETHASPDAEPMLTAMISEMMQRLTDAGGRKLFAHLSDYIDPQDGDVYGPLRRALAKLDFYEEGRHKDFYRIGESELVLGRRLVSHDVQSVPPVYTPIRLTDIDEIPDTDGSYWLSWEIDAEADALQPSDFQMIFDQVAQWNGRNIFIAFPSDLATANDFMRSANFRLEGRLFDFYEDGVDQVRYRYDL